MFVTMTSDESDIERIVAVKNVAIGVSLLRVVCKGFPRAGLTQGLSLGIQGRGAADAAGA